MVSLRNTSRLILAKAQMSDMQFLFALRNDARVRKMSFNTEAIEWEHHSKWFLETIKNPNSCMFVAKVNRKRVGQVRVDLHANLGEIGVSITSASRGKGYAIIAVGAATKYFFKKYPNVNKIFAYIKPSNIASIKTFKRVGFRRLRIVKHKGDRALKMALIR